MLPGWMEPAMVSPDDALPGRETPMPVTGVHRVLGTPLTPPFPDVAESIVVGMGCFWGAERRFWELPGVVTTAAGFAGGFTPNPTYDEVCSGRTGHAEAVLVVFDPSSVDLDAVLRCFWEHHDPTQGYRQGGDVGTQYRSAIFPRTAAQERAALESRRRYDAVLRAEHFDPITTEVLSDAPFFYAEPEHQQHLAANPDAYCGDGGTGVSFPGDDEQPSG